MPLVSASLQPLWSSLSAVYLKIKDVRDVLNQLRYPLHVHIHSSYIETTTSANHTVYCHPIREPSESVLYLYYITIYYIISLQDPRYKLPRLIGPPHVVFWLSRILGNIFPEKYQRRHCCPKVLTLLLLS